MFSAIASVALKSNPEAAMTQLAEVVASLNDASASPRRWRFEPRAARAFSTASDPRGDAGAILFSSNGFTEIVDSGVGRHSFPLKRPGVAVFHLAAFVRNSHPMEARRMESILVGLRDETHQAAALNALAARRLNVTN